MKKLLLISSAIIISLLLSVVLACTFFIIPISNTLANWQLQRLYPDSNIHVSTLNFNQLTLDEFYIQSPTLNINIKNANITYTPTQLWEGQVSDIVIDIIRTQISIKEDKQESIEKIEGSNSFELPLHPLDLIPLNSLVIKKATLIIENQGQIDASISLNKRKAEDINNLKDNQLELIGSFNLTPNGIKTIPLELFASLSNDWKQNIEISNNNKILLKHEGDFSIADQLTVNGAVNVNAHKILALAKQWIPSLNNYDAEKLLGNADYDISLPWPISNKNILNDIKTNINISLSGSDVTADNKLNVQSLISKLNIASSEGEFTARVTELNATAMLLPALFEDHLLSANNKAEINKLKRLTKGLSVGLEIKDPLVGIYSASKKVVNVSESSLHLFIKNKVMTHKLLLENNKATVYIGDDLKAEQKGRLSLDFRFATKDIPVKKATLNMPYSISVADVLSVTINKEAKLSLYNVLVKEDEGINEKIVLPKIIVDLNNNAILYRNKKGETNASNTKFSVSHSGLKIGDKKLYPLTHNANLKLISVDPLKLSGKLNTNNIEFTGIPKTNFNTTFNFNSKQFIANWEIGTLNNSLNINGLLQHDTNKGIGGSSIVIDDLKLNELELTEVIGDMPLEILEGDLKTEIELSWKSNSHKNNMPPLIQVTGDITLDNLTSNYDGVLIENAYFPIVFNTQNNKPITIKSNASIETINVGVPIKNIVGEHKITLSQDLTKFIYKAKNIDLQVLGGHISIPEAAYDSSKNVQAVGIYISDLNLSQLDILKEKAGLSATGKLNGALPIVLTKQGISIPAGTLKALSPGGVISHDQNSTVQAFSQGSTQMKMLFEILEKFNYDELSTDVLLKQDGSLSLQCRLQGKNKDYMNGQAVNFNPHLNINILDALRVMRITNKTTESLDKMFK